MSSDRVGEHQEARATMAAEKFARCPITGELGERCRLDAGHQGEHAHGAAPVTVAIRTVDAVVNHPPHYCGVDPRYEHYRVMIAWGLIENAFLYNATKYLCRLGKKAIAPRLEDLRKARWYLERAIEQEETAERVARLSAPISPEEKLNATCAELGCGVEQDGHSVFCRDA